MNKILFYIFLLLISPGLLVAWPVIQMEFGYKSKDESKPVAMLALATLVSVVIYVATGIIYLVS